MCSDFLYWKFQAADSKHTEEATSDYTLFVCLLLWIERKIMTILLGFLYTENTGPLVLLWIIVSRSANWSPRLSSEVNLLSAEVLEIRPCRCRGEDVVHIARLHGIFAYDVLFMAGHEGVHKVLGKKSNRPNSRHGRARAT